MKARIEESHEHTGLGMYRGLKHNKDALSVEPSLARSIARLCVRV
jgi:hypothetical protein